MCGRHSARPVVNFAMTMSKFEAEMGVTVSSFTGLSTNNKGFFLSYSLYDEKPRKTVIACAYISITTTVCHEHKHNARTYARTHTYKKDTITDRDKGVLQPHSLTWR